MLGMKAPGLKAGVSDSYLVPVTSLFFLIFALCLLPFALQYS